MDLKYILLFMILMKASVLTGAFAQNTGTGDLNSLIKFINENERKPAADSIPQKETENKGNKLPAADSVPTNLSDVLAFLTMSEGEEADYIPDKTNSILEALIRQEEGKKNKEVSSLIVLDYLTDAYAAHGFYQTGKWEDAEDFSYIRRNITLPEYDPDDFYRPVSGRITSNYGFRKSFGRIHKGIDLALNMGDTVRAALPGVVAKVGYDVGGYGLYIVLVHNNGMETRYAHLQKTVPEPGTRVYAGEPVGLGGNSGNSTGPHLHFEIRYRGTAVDPASVFNFHDRSMKAKK